MTSYVAITNGDIDQDSPVIQPLLTAMRDNPIAMLEGADDAAYNWFSLYPYDGVTVGDSDGVIYDFAVDGAAAVFETPTFEAGFDYALWFDGFGHGDAGSITATLNLYEQGNAAWLGNIVSVTLVTAETYTGGPLIIEAPMRLARSHQAHWEGGLYRVGTGAVVSGTGFGTAATDSTSATEQRISKARIRLDAGAENATAGKIRMLRRRTYIYD